MRSIFETERMLVRPLRESDLESFHVMQGDPEVMKYTTGSSMTLEEDQKDLSHVISCYSNPKNEFWVWAIDLKESKNMVGTCAVIRNDLNEVEIGFRFIRNFWNLGLASEILRPLLKHSFGLFEVDLLVAYVDVRNIASIKVLEKAQPETKKETKNPDTGLPDYKYIFHLSDS